ncbi:Glutamate receptor 2.8 [Acorus calamus]|uniref:Glutamate receptor 2.8 n=1 Tax=Acorus calamus TaxID=4465 RepID=A0AAV9CZS4_ACOCL|nr:Glutamate receptor 2.8 [Acorus calamus]
MHLPHALKVRLFSKARQAGMMSAGYAWITTYMPTSDFDFIDPPTIKAMQGVLAVTPYVPRSKALDNFTARWNATSLVETEPRAFGLWAYDTVWALAMAAEKAKHGLALLEAIKNIKFYGLSGYFRLINGQLQPLGFQYINVVGSPKEIGFWRPTRTGGNVTFYNRLVTWPGGSTATPRGWEIPPMKGEKLRVGVPKRTGFDQFVRVNGKHNVTGYSIDVFNSVMAQLPYDMPYTFVVFEDSEGNISGTYDDLTYHVYLNAYDAVVGDVTIIANRSLYVDFTQPYTDSGVSMVVPVQRGEDGNSWRFLKPLSVDLWCASMALFVFTGIVVWVIEHRINNEFRGTPVHQLGLIFYYSFSTLVFAHRERLESNLSKFAVFTWVFVVFVLNSNYTASVTSMLTAQQLQPTVTDAADLLKHGDFVGYQEGSFVLELLKGLGFNKAKIKSYRTPDEYAEALSRGSHNGGVAAIFDEIPYLRFFLRKYCDEYTMIGPTYRTDGFGFVFPKGSPLVADVSRAILNVREGYWMVEIEKKWLGDQNSCLNHGSISRSNSLSFASFWGLFLITGVTSTSALIIYIIRFLYYSRYELDASAGEGSILRKLVSLAKHFNQRDDFKSHRSACTATVMPTTSCAETVQNSPDARVSESHSFNHLYERFNQQARSPREI